MKKGYIICLTLAHLFFSAQIGINTNQPQSALDVNGDVNIRGKIFLKDGTELYAGKKEQVLVSQGAGKAPVWRSLKVPNYEPNKYYLIFNDSFKDLTGIEFPPSESGTFPAPTTINAELIKGANLSTLLGRGFKEITSLSKTFSVSSTTSKAYIQFETVVQVNGSAAGNIKYACGIFVNNLLESVRVNTLYNNGNSGSFLTHTQIGIVQGLTISDTHKVQVACARYNTSLINNFTIGTWAQNNLNNFSTQSSLKIDVYEVPSNFNPIFD